MITLAALILRGEYNPHSILMLVGGDKYSPPPLTAEEKKFCLTLEGKTIEHRDMPMHVRLNYPQWMDAPLKESLGEHVEEELRGLNEQAAMDLRVNTLKTTREELQEKLKAEGFDVAPTPVSPVGLRLAKRAPIFTSQYFKAGHFEVQDEASQLVSLLVGAEAGMKVIDFCAGAGGKTLAMAATMKNKGRILAWDNSEKRLKQLSPRLKRAGADNVQTHAIENESDQFIKRHKASADRVLVDAPCSGSGTWRRNPDLKWRFTQKDLDEVRALQQAILESAARLVKPGGRLVYATCSLLQAENEDQIQRFLEKNNEFVVVSIEKIWDKTELVFKTTPYRNGMDGFFATLLERRVKSEKS